MTSGTLERLTRQARARWTETEERCDLCGETLPADHRHMFDTDRAEVLCACRACSVLFVQDAASKGHYRLVPRRRIRLAPVSTKPLGVPVGLAFFVPRGDGTVLAHYPSPAGATRWEVDPSAWQEVVGSRPELDTLVADVEALLVNTARGQQHHWIVPVDDCHRMVAVVRREWRGLSGGSRVWPAIEQFFTELTEQQ
ncbi:DUF5947 family protein [Streptantibioticus rubrisoli]|uniref:DUF5947 family protein n=1 Tax=Streptantibioticus rubrisoli TaxID=1387313 RepID=A0ABT1P7R4_9ACTN|nr:DUF5947 family protein [Streptantibioticus rubrisoli]MCQ4041419.1 DUF5947 family protein [Streptantibioticus rubrisoli]